MANETTPYFAELMRQANNPYQPTVRRAMDAVETVRSMPTRTVPKGLVPAFIDTVDPYETRIRSPRAASVGTTGDNVGFWDQFKDDEVAGNIATGLYSAADSALFGIPNWAIRGLSPETAKRIKELQDQYKAAALVGEIGGAFVPTGGALFKGVGLGAKAIGLGKVAKGLDTAGDIVRGTKAVKGLGGAVQRGALAGVEQAVPRMMSGDTDLAGGALMVGAGGALGAAGHGLQKAIEYAPESLAAIRKWGTKTMLKRAGLDSRTLRAQAPYLGADPDNAEAWMKGLGELVRDEQLYREPRLDKFRKGVTAEWQARNAAYGSTEAVADSVAQQAAAAARAALPADAPAREVAAAVRAAVDDATVDIPGSVAYLKKLVLSKPETVDIMKRIDSRAVSNPRVSTTSQGVVDELFDALDNTKGLASKRSYLADLAYDKNVVSGIPAEKQRLARITRDTLDDVVTGASGQSPEQIARMKAEYGMKAALTRADLREELGLAGAGIQRGSDTAAKLALSGLGAAVGGVGGASTQIKGLIDDPSDPEAWNRFLTATLGGVAVGGASKVIGNTLAQVATRLDPADLAAFAERVAGEKTLAGVAKFAEKAAALTAGLEPLSTAATKVVAQEVVPEIRETQKAGQALMSAAPRVDQYGQLVTPTAEEPTPIEPTAENSKYLDFVEQRLWNRFIKQGYASNVAQRAALQGQDPNEAVNAAFNQYVAMAYQKTNGYDVQTVAPYIFEDGEEAGMFINLINAMNLISDPTMLKVATSVGGMFGAGRAPENAMAQILIALDAAGVPDRIGGRPTKEYVNSLLRQFKKDPTTQRDMLLELIRRTSKLSPQNVDAALAAGGLS